MPTPSKQPTGARRVDGSPEVQSEAVPSTRTDSFYLEAERIQSGGLDDDPTDSGEPVRNRRSHGKLTGGR